MAVATANQAWSAAATGVIVLNDGSVYYGQGAGARGEAVGELCFNTAMTGHQEILADPSYAQQIICFTAPHVGNVGANPRDEEASSPAASVAARGAVTRAPITPPSNWRASQSFDDWLARRGIVTVSGVDTRAITRRIRAEGMPHAVIAYDPDGAFDLEALTARAKAWPGIVGAELAGLVTAEEPYEVTETPWTWPGEPGEVEDPLFHVVVIDYGVKRNILRRLAAVGARCTVVPAAMPAADILDLKPDGVVLANGPGDPAATAEYAAPEIRALAASGTPLLGICLGHQLLALAFGAKTVKMAHGHHGANHPVKDLATGAVEIVSMNHGFAVDAPSLPPNLRATHLSLFDGSNCGLEVADAPAFSVQHHPEASPGPHDAKGVFTRFADLMVSRRAAR